MSKMQVRSLAACLSAFALLLCFAGTASALSKPVKIGSNTTGLPSVPAVAVDPVGNLYTVWLDQPADTTLTFCKVPIGAVACAPVKLQVPDSSSAQFFDPPSVVVNGSDVYLFEEVDGVADKHLDGYDEWVSTDGGATFVMLPHAVSWTGVGDVQGAGPMPVFQVFGGGFGIGEISAVSNPLVQANNLAAPVDYSAATLPTQYATLPAGFTTGNLGGEFVSQLGGSTTGVLGVFQLIKTGPCRTSDGLVFSWAGMTSATTNAQLNTSSSWSSLAPIQCNAEYPAVTGGHVGLGVLFTSEASTFGTTQYRAFTAPGKFAPAVTVAAGAALQPSISQDSAGNLYATWLTNGTGLRLAYSADGGLGWDGDRTIARESSSVTVDSVSSAVGSDGRGWAVYASNGGEYAQSFDASDADVTPVDRGLSVKPSSFASSAAIHYVDSEAATTTFKVVELEKGHKVPIGSFTHPDLNGAMTVPFPAKVGGHSLASGRYELEATPTLGSLTGATAKASFTIT